MNFAQFLSQFFLLFLLKSTFPNNFTLYDDAHFTRNGAISLTRELPGSVGRALHATPIQFRDPSTNSTPSFSCTFSFTIARTPFSAPGKGLAFLITSANSSSSALLGRAMGGVRESFLAVEFDTGFDRIGLDVDGVLISAVSTEVDLRSGRKITSWVEYQDETKRVKIWVSHLSFKPSAPVISTSIDLSEKVLKEFMHVGFSASNGVRGSARHFVESWEFANFGFLSTVAAKEEEGLIRDDVQLMFVRLIILLGCLAFPILIGYIRRYCSSWELNGRIPLNKLYKLTNGFDPRKRAGQETEWGESVYPVRPFFRKPVVIKKFMKVERVSDFEQLGLERAGFIRTLKHKNLLQLQGWCFEESELILVYKCVEGQTLRQMLDVVNTSRGELNCERSLNILTQVASALAYLHGKGVIHDVVQTRNIMVDGNRKTKLGGFGFSHMFPQDPVTRAYLAPEYYDVCGRTTKCDVYSFGVVVLEVVTRCPPVDSQGVRLVDKVVEVQNLERELDAAHARVGDTWDRDAMRQVLKLGWHCTGHTAAERPEMSDVEGVLKGEVSLDDAVKTRLQQ